MADTGAGGLSTAAIERCIDNWEVETQDGDEIPAARAELAALVEAAGRATALAAALAAWQAWDAYLDTEPWGKPEMIDSGTLHHRARRLTRAALADAGPGAAGEPPPAVTKAELDRETDDWRGAAEQAPGELRPLEAPAVLARRLDAVRAGGAGEEAADGGDGRH
jgi:hypothetical protein